MTDWEKLKVTELKDELKARGIPLTGLKLKQQLIDKLVEVDTGAIPQSLDDSPEDDSNDGQRQRPDDQILTQHDTDGDTRMANTSDNAIAERKESKFQQISPSPKLSTSIETAPAGVLPADREGTNIDESDPEIPEKEKERTSIFVPEEDEKKVNIPEGGTRADEPQQHSRSSTPLAEKETVENIKLNAEVEASTLPDHREASRLSPQATASSTRLPTPEALEDQRKRKRRSLSPPPDTQEMQKRARGENGQPVMTRQESEALDAIKEATALVQDGRAAGDVDELPILPMEASVNPEHTRVAKEVGGLPDALELNTSIDTRPNLPKSDAQPLDLDKSRQVPPALHPATSSLYIRNFKRPLHIPSLRAHISRLAKLSQQPDDDPINFFYLDAIRTHAFISFASTTAASRVRSQMHGIRYPDESIRDPLWIDFIPDDKVQSWIDQETGRAKDGFGAGRGTAKKYEVIYEKVDGYMKATLRIASDAGPRYQGHQQQASRIPLSNSASIVEASGIHPDRAGLVAQTTRKQEPPGNSPQSRISPIPIKSNQGTGFKALDELFSFTSTKPKLYYRTVSESVVDDRLDLLRNLAVAHAGMGRSGDEGMKRYSFEGSQGRQEWVDKGPEFGFGRKGQDRLEGFRGRGQGGTFRGRGRGGGSWRGGI